MKRSRTLFVLFSGANDRGKRGCGILEVTKESQDNSGLIFVKHSDFVRVSMHTMMGTRLDMRIHVGQSLSFRIVPNNPDNWDARGTRYELECFATREEAEQRQAVIVSRPLKPWRR
jgi:hypothetical protein